MNALLKHCFNRGERNETLLYKPVAGPISGVVGAYSSQVPVKEPGRCVVRLL